MTNEGGAVAKKLTRKCRMCGRRFKAATRRADWCSPACSQRAYRLRREVLKAGGIT